MTSGYDGRDDERDGRVFDLHPAEPRGDLPWRVRRAQVIQTLTESAGEPYGYGYGYRPGRRGLTDDASPQLRTVAANAVTIGRAVLLLVLNIAGSALTLTLLVRILEWLS
jgi:hypothetical protein